MHLQLTSSTLPFLLLSLFLLTTATSTHAAPTPVTDSEILAAVLKLIPQEPATVPTETPATSAATVPYVAEDQHVMARPRREGSKGYVAFVMY